MKEKISIALFGPSLATPFVVKRMVQALKMSTTRFVGQKS